MWQGIYSAKNNYLSLKNNYHKSIMYLSFSIAIKKATVRGRHQKEAENYSQKALSEQGFYRNPDSHFEYTVAEENIG